MGKRDKEGRIDNSWCTMELVADVSRPRSISIEMKSIAVVVWVLQERDIKIT